MIPIRDTLPSRNRPVVTQAIIGLNVLVFLLQMAQGSEVGRFVYIYGLVPARYVVPELKAYFSPAQQVFSFVSFMFLHGGFFHLLFNMWSLYIFGDNVEDRLGPIRYLIFYLLCGMASGLFHLVTNIYSNVPTIGASGAVAGVMGAYFILHPGARILTLIPIIFIPWFVEIPAFIFLGVWFLLQLLNAAGSQGAGGIAWWAHIGGFIFGIVFLKLALKIPTAGLTEHIKPYTARKKSHRLQVIHPGGAGDDPNLYGTIELTPVEAYLGARKIVNIPWGFQKRLVKVTVPPGMENGKMLKLSGMGKVTSNGQRGDLLLKVRVR